MKNVRFLTTRQIAYIAVSTVLVFVLTAYVKVNNFAGGSGFLNLGDAGILFVATLFGPIPGLIAGGLGSLLGDLAAGYVHWMPFTLVIKSIMGLVAGLICKKAYRKISKSKWNYAVIFSGYVVVEIIMVLGYFVAKIIMYKYGMRDPKGEKPLQLAVASIPGNLIQATAGIIVAMLCVLTTKFSNRINIDIFDKKAGEEIEEGEEDLQPKE